MTDGGLQGNLYEVVHFPHSTEGAGGWRGGGTPYFGKLSQELCWVLSINMSAARCLAAPRHGAPSKMGGRDAWRSTWAMQACGGPLALRAAPPARLHPAASGGAWSQVPPCSSPQLVRPRGASPGTLGGESEVSRAGPGPGGTSFLPFPGYESSVQPPSTPATVGLGNPVREMEQA